MCSRLIIGFLVYFVLRLYFATIWIFPRSPCYLSICLTIYLAFWFKLLFSPTTTVFFINGFFFAKKSNNITWKKTPEVKVYIDLPNSRANSSSFNDMKRKTSMLNNDRKICILFGRDEKKKIFFMNQLCGFFFNGT